MTNMARLLGAAAAIGAIATPAAAQYYPQQYPQQYPQTYPPQQYPGYGYPQGTTGNPITDVIDQLLGNRYNVSDRQAVRQCSNAARAQAAQQYGAYGNSYGQRYGQGYGQSYGQAYGANLRVTAITNVERRNNGLRVSGLMSSGYGNQYGNQYGYQNQAYGGGDVTFRCNVDYRGAVTNIRIGRNNGYRR